MSVVVFVARKSKSKCTVCAIITVIIVLHSYLHYSAERHEAPVITPPPPPPCVKHIEQCHPSRWKCALQKLLITTITTQQYMV